MDALIGMVFLAMLATIGALVTGIGSMAGGGSYDEQHSHQWMTLRVVFQAIAVGLLLVVVLLQGG
jgi:hypothetical protein